MQENMTDNIGTGYLLVKASTARGAIPLENASVNIRSTAPLETGIIRSLKTNSSGITDKISLPTPPRSLSESPGILLPYATYDIDVFKDGYLPVYLKNVAVFDSITSIQPAIMIPLEDNKYTDNYARTSDSSPSDRNT
jgi:hypothetical protein